MKKSLIALIAVSILALFLILPALVLWAINTLASGSLYIEHNAMNYLAVVALLVCFGRGSSK